MCGLIFFYFRGLGGGGEGGGVCAWDLLKWKGVYITQFCEEKERTSDWLSVGVLVLAGGAIVKREKSLLAASSAQSVQCLCPELRRVVGLAVEPGRCLLCSVVMTQCRLLYVLFCGQAALWPPCCAVLVSVYIACVCVVCQSGRPLLDMFDIFGAVSTTTK